MITDASPLIFYGKINRLDLLYIIYKPLVISEEVYQETVIRGKGHPDSKIIQQGIDKRKIIIKLLTKEYRQQVSDILEKYSQLDRGEAETIILALQEKETEVLIDEELARKVARLEGLTTYGSLRVALLAYQKKLLSQEELHKLVRDLINAGLWINADVLESFYELLKKMGE